MRIEIVNEIIVRPALLQELRLLYGGIIKYIDNILNKYRVFTHLIYTVTYKR